SGGKLALRTGCMGIASCGNGSMPHAAARECRDDPSPSAGRAAPQAARQAVLDQIVRNPNYIDMSTTPFQRQQVASGIEQLAALARAQSRRPEDGVPALPPAHSAVLR